MKDVDLGWLAGIIDGEGSVVLTRRGKFRQPVLTISSTDIEMLKKVKLLIDGTIHSKKESRNPEYKPCWVWKKSGAQKVMKILKLLIPHMTVPSKIKRSKYIIKNYNRVTKRNGYYTDTEKKKKIEFEEGWQSLA